MSETTALSAALASVTPFATRAGTLALGAADRSESRWAREDVSRGGLAAVGFVDRMMAPMMTMSRRMPAMRSFGARTVAAPNWLFPRPWYQDELAWVAANEATEQAPGGVFTTRGTFAASAESPLAALRPPMEFVAPSLARGGDLAPAATTAAVWSPLVSYAEAQRVVIAAEARRVESDEAPRFTDLAVAADAVPANDGEVAVHAARQPAMAEPTVLRFAPVAGPRVVFPAGLGGLVAMVEPHAAAPSLPALAGVASERPAAIDHVTWADRWLARLAGASPRALRGFDVSLTTSALAAPEAVAARSRNVPDPVFVAPPAPAALRIADDQGVPDEVFAAIARARSAPAPRPAAPAVAPAAAMIPSAPTIPFAERVVAQPPSMPVAGLHPGLASSPVAPALAHLAPLPSAPIFDTRGLDASLIDAILAGYYEPEAPVVAGQSAPRARTQFAPIFVAPAAAEMPTVTQAARAPAPSAWMQPGATALRAHDWSVAEEQQAASLSFDFASPELVVAARSYGLGPADAVEAARMAAAGPSSLSTMASNLDLAFLRALAAPTPTAESATRPAMASVEISAAPVVASSSESTTSSESASSAPEAPRHRARGAFLWPAGVISALGLEAPTVEGQAVLPMAALEILAARSIIDLQSYAAPASRAMPVFDPAAARSAPMSAAGMTPMSATMAPAPTATGEVGDDVAAPTAERFRAIYLALTQGPTASLSPSARAAQALAMVTRSDASSTALERAQIAWSILPEVFVHPSAEPSPVSPSQAPEMVSIAARAGSSLGAFVAPSRAEVETTRAATRADFVPETTYVNTAPTKEPASPARDPRRPFARAGGGEVEIPPWFEAAARKMLDQRGNGGDGISLAEMTLVVSAGASQMAAATVGESPASQAPSGAAAQASAPSAEAPDVERLAEEVYSEILRLIDIARERNGEPFL